MTNTLNTPGNIASLAAVLVGKDLGLAALVYRNVEADFAAGLGATVRLSVPGAVPARTRGSNAITALESDSITEQSISVVLDTEAYSRVILSDQDLDLDLKDFGSQVLLPQTGAIVKYVERTLATAMQATPATIVTYDAAAPAKAFTAIRAALRTNGVQGSAHLFAAVGSTVYGDLLDGPAGTFDADGKVRGVTVVESTRLAATEVVAFIPEAFALVVRAPLAPQGAPFGASVKVDDGDTKFAIRHIRAFEPAIGADTSLVTAFVGVQAMPLAVDDEAGLVTLVPNGGVIRVVTA